jgi:toxin secretion/phage lysis holin
MAEKMLISLSAAGAVIINYIGGWSAHVWMLGILMGIDYAIGLLMPLFTGKSKKNKRGKMESGVAVRGVIKKCVMLLMVYVSYLLGRAADVQFLADGVCIAFILSEVISITEHAAVIGVPIPKVLVRAINVVHDKTGAGIDALAGTQTDTKQDEIKTEDK